MSIVRLRPAHVVHALLWALLANPVAADFEAGLDATDAGDYTTAFNEFARAAAEGDLRAANALGQLYERGDGVQTDPARAAEWYRRAAEAGNREAQYNLAGMYRSGDGLPLDAALSMQWYRRAADQRLAIAQFFVGKNYEHGQGVEQDLAEAWAWYSLAAVAGDDGSARNRDRVARFLNEEQRQRAVILLRDHALELTLPPSTLRALGVTPPSGDSASADDDTQGAITVSAIQDALKALGYDIGESDGVAGPRTRGAISEFATSVGMEGDPRIGPLLLEQLRAASTARVVAARELDTVVAAAAEQAAPMQPPQDVVSAADTAVTAVAVVPVRELLGARLQALGYDRLDDEAERRAALAAFARDAGLEPGTLGDEAMLARMDALLPEVRDAPGGTALVRAVQSELARLGHDPGPLDGVMGGQTRAALASFAADFPQLPRVTPVLLARLRIQQQGSAWTLVETPSTPGVAVATPAPIASSDEAVPAVATAAAEVSTAPAEVQPPTGEALVRAVQSRLADLGYEPGPVDGLTGSRTRRAAAEFRADRELPGDTVDTLLWRQLSAVHRAGGPPVSGGEPASATAPLPTLVAAPVQDTPAPAPASVDDPVSEAQRLLAMLGFDVGEADGVIGTRTRNAVRAFDRAHGGDGDGRIDDGVIARLREAVDEKGRGGRDADAVREAQQLLLARGYRPGPVDGQIGSQMRASVAEFQRDEGLVASGQLDLPTVARLRTAPPSPKLGVGLLREVQSALGERGYDPGPVDGAMGPSTRAALASFRRDQGLPGDAVLDVGLLRRLGLAPGG